MTGKKKRDSNYDLERAQQKVIAAGQPELADALYDYAQASRNYMQGDFGKSFIDSLVKYVVPLQESSATTERILGQVVQRLDQQIDLVQQVLGAYKHLQAQMKESQEDRRLIHEEIAEVKEDVAALQSRLDRYDEIERRLSALEHRGDVQP